MNTTEEVVNYITELTNESITDHSMNLFENGYLNSLDVLDLVSFIEDRFKVNVDADDVDLDNIATINGIVKLIDMKLTSK